MFSGSLFWWSVLLTPFALYLLGSLHPSAGVRGVARTILLLVGILFLAGTAFCFVFPFFQRDAGVLVLPGIVLGFLTWLLLSLRSGLVKSEQLRGLTGTERITAERAQFAATRVDLMLGIERDRKRASSIWLAPGKRRELKQRIAHQESLLRGLEQMESALERGRAEERPGPPGSPS